MKNKILIIFISSMLLFVLVSCSGFFNSSKTKVGVGDVILNNGYRIPFEYVENFSENSNVWRDLLGIVYAILDDGNYMVMCPNQSDIYGTDFCCWVERYYDDLYECYYPTIDVPYLGEIDEGDSCGDDNWEVVKTELQLSDSYINSFPIFNITKNFNEYLSQNYKDFNSGWYVPTWQEVKDMDVNIINKVVRFNGSFNGSFWLSNIIENNCAKIININETMEQGERVYKLDSAPAYIIDYNKMFLVRNFTDLDESKVVLTELQYQDLENNEE